jgi:transcriptional regulator with XRE-family HTH domain
MADLAQRILGGSEPGRVAGAVEQIAEGALGEIEGSLPGALAGDRRQVHLYVNAYRRLADRVLDAAGGAHLEQVGTPWFRAALEQSAMSAPFSEWVGRLGVGRGTAVAFVASMREGLPGVEPLRSSARRRPPDWDLVAADVLRFYRAVVEELELAEMPLERVQAALGLSRTEFAAMFGVRRQALDHWEASGVPAERQEKVATIEEIADLLTAKLKRERIPAVVRRPSPAYGERSALEAIAEGDQELVLAELRDAFDWATAA